MLANVSQHFMTSAHVWTDMLSFIAKNEIESNSTSDDCYHVLKIDFNICETDKRAMRMLLIKITLTIEFFLF